MAKKKVKGKIKIRKTTAILKKNNAGNIGHPVYANNAAVIKVKLKPKNTTA